MKTSELIGAQLDWLVAKCLYEASDTHEPHIHNGGVRVSLHDEGFIAMGWFDFLPSTDWSQGGPIIEREEISTIRCASRVKGVWTIYWEAAVGFEDEPGHGIQYGHTPLIAAMRCLVASKLGDDVDIPEELK